MLWNLNGHKRHLLIFREGACELESAEFFWRQAAPGVMRSLGDRLDRVGRPEDSNRVRKYSWFRVFEGNKKCLYKVLVAHSRVCVKGVFKSRRVQREAAVRLFL